MAKSNMYSFRSLLFTQQKKNLKAKTFWFQRCTKFPRKIMFHEIGEFFNDFLAGSENWNQKFWRFFFFKLFSKLLKNLLIKFPVYIFKIYFWSNCLQLLISSIFLRWNFADPISWELFLFIPWKRELRNICFICDDEHDRTQFSTLSRSGLSLASFNV